MWDVTIIRALGIKSKLKSIIFLLYLEENHNYNEITTRPNDETWQSLRTCRLKNMSPEENIQSGRFSIEFFFFFKFMSDAHHGINSSTQKYQSTQSSVVLTSCRPDSGSPPF